MVPWTDRTSVTATVVIQSLDPLRFGVRHRYCQSLVSLYKGLSQSVFDHDVRQWHFPMSSYDEVIRRIRAVPGAVVEELPPFVRDGILRCPYLLKGACLGSGRMERTCNKEAGSGPSSRSSMGDTNSGCEGGSSLGKEAMRRLEEEEEVKHRMESVPEGLMATLFPFQVECLRFAIKRQGRILLGEGKDS